MAKTMTAETTPTAPTPITRASERVSTFMPSVANLALDVVDRSQSTAIAVLQDARGELRSFVDSGIDFAEKGVASLFRFARSFTKRIDEGVADTLTGTERLLSSAVKNARESTKPSTAN